jgi:glutaredoxin
VNIKVFTSTDCHWCKDAEAKLRKTTNRLDNIVNIDVIDVQSDRFMREKTTRIDMLPTIQIGNNTIVGDFDEDQVWKHIFEAYNK